MDNPFKAINEKLNNIEAILKDLKTNPSQASQTPQKQVFNFEQGCKYLGICKSFGYKLTSNRKIPHSKRGKRIYFEKSELDNWLISNKVKDINAIQKDADNYNYTQKKGLKYGK